MPVATKRWRLIRHSPEQAADLARRAGISSVVAQLLLNRGITDPTQAKLFLDSPMTLLHHPHLLPGVEAAAVRIIQAVRERRKICIYGDYDVDGTTGTSILLGVLMKLGAAPEFYIPNRSEEGYGVNLSAIRSLAAEGVQLIITVDCGITSVEEAQEAKRLGVEFIVTDHHGIKDQLPAASVLVHPALPGSAYPHQGISGAGVAFKLAWAIGQLASGSDRVLPEFREQLLDYLVLGALGCVADVMPLRDENRAFVKHGLERLKKKPSVGQRALLESARLSDVQALKAEDIGFKLAPRLNAAGRLECARLVVELLTTTNPIRAREIAEYLEELNTKRRSLERKSTAQAKELVELNGYHADSGIVLASADWHQGVVGIIAARILETYSRPTLIIADKGESGPSSGSGRSMPQVPLNELLKECADLLVTFGGHEAACGFKVETQNIPALRERFNRVAQKHFQHGPPDPILKLESEVPLTALTFSLMEELNQLEPFGPENPRPKFLATDLRIEGTPRQIGKEQRHLSFRVKQGQTVIRAVAFGMGDRLDELMSQGGACCLALTPKINEWNGYRSVEIEVNDFQAGSTPELV